MIQQALSFVAVVNAGSFAQAARMTGFSKAQLSRHVAQLEASLGMQLLFRTTRALSLTEQGEQFYQSCHEIKHAFDHAVDEVKHDFSHLKGSLSITAPITLGTTFLVPLIHQFTQQYPDLKISLTLSSQTEDLIASKFDLAVRIAPSLPDSSLRVRHISRLDVILYSTNSYLNTAPPLTHPKELIHHRCVTSINRSHTRSHYYWPFYIDNNLEKFQTNNVLEIDNQQAQAQMVLQGAGIARAPKYFIQQQLNTGELVQVLPDFKQPDFHVYLLYPDRKTLPKKLRLFSDFICEHAVFDKQSHHC